MTYVHPISERSLSQLPVCGMLPWTGRTETNMDRFAVAAIPVMNVDEWLTFCREAAEGDRADAHRQFLRRGGVTRSTSFCSALQLGI
jgi:hypothetical protein